MSAALLALLLAALLAPSQDGDFDWAGARGRLAALVERARQAAERAEAFDARKQPEWRGLESAARAQAGSFPGDLIAVHLGRLAGHAALRLAEGVLPAALEPEEALLVAEVLEPGARRAGAWAQVVRQADATPPREGLPSELDRVLGPAYRSFRADADALRLADADVIARAMHERARAPWSAENLALLATRMGEHERAARILERQLEGASGPLLVQLLQTRGLIALGAGDEETALDVLGRAAGLGGRDAMQMLGQHALARGEHERAAALFRVLLLPAPPDVPDDATPWALRGWGLALLPRR